MKKQLSQYDKMTKTPIPKLIVNLGIPSVLSMLITNIYNMVDTAFVGRLGNSASGAVGVVFGYMAILQAFGFMFGQGSGSLASRKLGAKDQESASRIASTGFFYCFGCGIIIMVVSLIFLDKLVMMLGSTETIAPYAKQYIFFILLAAPFLMSSLVMNNLLRYEGKAALGMIGMMTGSILNMIMDPIFMFSMGLGVTGAGLSTAISQMISFVILLAIFLMGKSQIKLSIRRVTRSAAELLDICGTGLPSLLRQGLNSATTIMLNASAAVYGDAAVAAMSIVTRIVMFVFSMALGIGQGYQPVAAFNYGAKKYKRVRQGFKATLLISSGILAVAMTIVLAKSGSMIQIFRDDPTVIEIGTRALRLQCLTLLISPICVCMEMTLQCTGRKLLAAIMSSMRSGIFFIPLLYILARTRGMLGIEEAQPAAFVLSSIMAALFALRYFKTFPREDEPDAKGITA